MGRLEIRLLGEMTLSMEGRLLTFPTQKVKELLAYLITYQTHAHPRTVLAGLLWSDSNEEKATTNFRKTLSLLRKLLDSKASKHSWLASSGGAVRFNPKAGEVWCDVIEFEHLLAEGANAKNSEILERALALYRGPFLRGIYSDWVLLETERLQSLYLEALEQLAESYQAHREYAKAIQAWQKALHAVPWHERAHRELMTLYALSGDRATALSQYQKYIEVLQAELQVKPLPETHALYEQLKQGRLVESVKVRELPADLPFVGRERQRGILQKLWQDVIKGQGQTVLIAGEIGVGKTRFVQHFITQFQCPLPRPEATDEAEGREKICVLHGACHALGGALPYQALLQALREGLQSVSTETLQEIPALWRSELLPFLPELHERFPELRANPELPVAQGKTRFFSALTGFFEFFARRRPFVLFLDDLHWADPATLEYLSSLVTHLKKLPLLLIGTYRAEEALEKAPFRAWLDALGPGRSYQPITLSRLSRNEVEWLLESWLGTGAGHTSPQLYGETDGNPLFVRELVHSLMQSGWLYQEEDKQWKLAGAEISPMQFPESLRELIHASLRRAPERTRGLLGLAAVIGRAFDRSILQTILRQPEEKLLQSLDQLRQSGLLVEREGQYRFYHEMVRQVVYEELGTDRRRLWHRQVGQALEALYSDRLEELAGELALHFEQAQLWGKAIVYAKRAGLQAQQTYAYEAARNFFMKALGFFEHLEANLSASDHFKHLRLEILNYYTGRGVFPTVADIKPALSELQTAVREMLDLATELRDEVKLCEAYRRRARLETAQGQWEAMRTTQLQALELGYRWIQKQPPDAGVASMLETTAELNKMLHKYNAALADYRRAAEIWATLGHTHRQGLMLGLITNVQLSVGQLAEARQSAERALEYLQGGDLWRQAGVLNNLGLILREMGLRQDVQTYYERALALMKATKDPRGIGIVLINLGALQTDQGHYAEALPYLQQALELISQAGTKGLEVELFSEIGRAHWGQGELPLALGNSERAVRLIEERHGFPTDEYRFYYTHSQILHACGQTDQARVYLQKACEDVQRIAAQLHDEELKKSFLENILIHREIIQAWQALQRPS